MQEKRIIGIYISERQKESVKIQEVLTKFGCYIRTRIGLNDMQNTPCNDCGLVLLEMDGNIEEAKKLEIELHKIQNLQIQTMSFNL